MKEKITAARGLIFILLVAGLLTGSAAAVSAAGTETVPLPYGWTREKMKDAIPYPMEEWTVPLRGVQAAVPQTTGTPGWAPSLPPDGWTRPLITGNPAGTYPPPAPTLNHVTDYVPLSDLVKFPHVATGKVYFSMGGKNYVCSGAVIGENTVWTAGHCISSGNGVFHDRWVFIPDFDNYYGPYGGYVAVYAVTPAAYGLHRDFSYDYAIVGVRNMSPGSPSVRQTVGAVGFAWNMPRLQQWLLLGYSLVTFNDAYQVFSQSTYYEDDPSRTPASVCGGSSIKYGGSGGPWLLNPMPGEAGEANYLNGVNSYIKSSLDEVCSPYLDDRAKRLWDCAQNSTQDKPVCPDSAATADLVLTNTAGSGPIPTGAPFTYTLKLENFGPADATNIVLTDHLPAEVSVTGFDLPGGTCSLDSPFFGIKVITCTLSTLPNGASAIATVVVNAPARGGLSNMASVTFDQSGEWNSAVGAYTQVCNGDHITVINTSDSGAGSLREALDTICQEGTIDFAPALSGAVIRLTSELQAQYSVTIDGSALPQRITLSGDTDGDGAGDTRVLSASGMVTLDSLIITKGRVAAFAGGELWTGGGGGINNSGILTLKNSAITDSSSDYGGGGIFNRTYGTLTALNSVLAGNTAPEGDGLYIHSGVEGMGTLNRLLPQGLVILTGNAAPGGGPDNNSALTIMDTPFSATPP